MFLGRRQVLRMVSITIGSGMLPQNLFGSAPQTNAEPKATAAEPAKPALPSESTMEKVTGIGGFFFRAHDPKTLGRWYQEHLGITVIPSSYGGSVWKQEAGTTAFVPFPETTHYFGDMNKMWMINFRVKDLDRMAAQLRSAGIEVKIDAQTYPNGRFASLKDPEGNAIQLWQPKE